MGAERVTGKDWSWEWTGSVKDLVDFVGNSDARVGVVKDLSSGAKIWMNLNGIDDPELTDAQIRRLEPFYIESPDGDNLYDAYNRKEAVKMLNNARAGRAADDDGPAVKARRVAGRQKKKAKKNSKAYGIRSIR